MLMIRKVANIFIFVNDKVFVLLEVHAKDQFSGIGKYQNDPLEVQIFLLLYDFQNLCLI